MKLTVGSLAGAITVVVLGQVLYHSIARGSGTSRSAFELVAIAYAVGLVLVVTVGALTDHLEFQSMFSVANTLRGLGLGVAVSMVEVGYVYSYKRGLPITTGAISVLAITSVALAPIGIVLFHEHLNPRVAVGALLAIAGIWLMRS